MPIFVPCHSLGGIGVDPPHTQTNTPKDMKNTAEGKRPRREKPMLDRALEYAKLYEGGKKADWIANKYDEHLVSVYKLIRLGNAPKTVHNLIRKGELPATEVANAITSSMTKGDIIAMAQTMVQARHDARKKLEEMGFKGASSMTFRRTVMVAIENLKQRHLIRDDKQKAIFKAFKSVFGQSHKPSIEDIEHAVLG